VDAKGILTKRNKKSGILAHLQHKKLNKKEKKQGDNFTRDYRLFLYEKLEMIVLKYSKETMSSLKSMEMAVCFTLLINNIEMWLTSFTKKYNHLCLIKKITWAMANCY